MKNLQWRKKAPTAADPQYFILSSRRIKKIPDLDHSQYKHVFFTSRQSYLHNKTGKKNKTIVLFTEKKHNSLIYTKRKERKQTFLFTQLYRKEA